MTALKALKGLSKRPVVLALVLGRPKSGLDTGYYTGNCILPFAISSFIVDRLSEATERLQPPVQTIRFATFSSQVTEH